MADPGSIRSREPSLRELALAAAERSRASALKPLFPQIEDPYEDNTTQALKDMVVSGVDLGINMVPFVQAYREGKPVPAIIDAIFSTVPANKAIPFILGAYRRPKAPGIRAEVPGAQSLEREFLAREAEDITSPEQLAQEIATRRAAREKITGSPAVGMQGLPSSHTLQARDLQREARASGLGARAAQERITDDVLLDNLVEMLESGEIPVVGSVQRGTVIKALPRELNVTRPGDLRDAAPLRVQVMEQEEARRATNIPMRTPIRSTESGGVTVAEYDNGVISVGDGATGVVLGVDDAESWILRSRVRGGDQSFANALEAHLSGPRASSEATAGRGRSASEWIDYITDAPNQAVVLQRIDQLNSHGMDVVSPVITELRARGRSALAHGITERRVGSTTRQVDPAFRAFVEDQIDAVNAGHLSREHFLDTFESAEELEDVLSIVPPGHGALRLALEERLVEATTPIPSSVTRAINEMQPAANRPLSPQEAVAHSREFADEVNAAAADNSLSTGRVNSLVDNLTANIQRYYSSGIIDEAGVRHIIDNSTPELAERIRRSVFPDEATPRAPARRAGEGTGGTRVPSIRSELDRMAAIDDRTDSAFSDLRSRIRHAHSRAVARGFGEEYSNFIDNLRSDLEHFNDIEGLITIAHEVDDEAVRESIEMRLIDILGGSDDDQAVSAVEFATGTISGSTLLDGASYWSSDQFNRFNSYLERLGVDPATRSRISDSVARRRRAANRPARRGPQVEEED